MPVQYPSPEDVGIRIPAHLREDRFRAGFAHALRGRNLRRAEHMRLSFREGFRAAKIYLRYLRRQQGLLEFPARWKFRMRAA